MKFTTILFFLTVECAQGFSTQTSSQINVLPSTQRYTFNLNAQPQTTKEESNTEEIKSEGVNGNNNSGRGQSREILDEASDALTSVGWSAPMLEEALTSDDPFVKRINEEIQKESGVNLDELLNPAKVRLLGQEREIIKWI